MIKEFNFSINLLKVILWQYDQAPNIQTWLQNKQNFADLNHNEFWDDWYTDVFNIDTANEFGISVWAIILNLPLLINLPLIDPNRVGWGFGQFRDNFNNGNFALQPVNGVQDLNLAQRRTAIKMRYQQITSNGTITNINTILNNAFGHLGSVYAIDNLDMTIQYTCEFPIPEWVEFFYDNLFLFPTPSGVADSLVEI